MPRRPLFLRKLRTARQGVAELMTAQHTTLALTDHRHLTQACGPAVYILGNDGGFRSMTHRPENPTAGAKLRLCLPFSLSVNGATRLPALLSPHLSGFPLCPSQALLFCVPCSLFQTGPTIINPKNKSMIKNK